LKDSVFHNWLEIENPDAMFQQDDAPAHFSAVVLGALNEKFPRRWFGRGGAMLWRPCSPDLTPLDFFMWSQVKNIVYAEKIPYINHLKERTEAAIRSFTPDILQRA
jgi:hypothetical protein